MRGPGAFFRQLIPGIPALLLGLVGALLALIWVLLSLAMLLDPLEGQTMAGASAVAAAAIFGPLSALFFAVAGLVDRRLLARAGWFYLAAATVFLAGMLLGVVFAFEPVIEGMGPADGESMGLGIFGGTCCGFTPMCLFLLPAIAFTSRGLRQLAAGDTPDALDAVVELLHRRGHASFAEITELSGLAPDRIEPVLFQLQQRGRLLCRVDPREAWVCTHRHEQRGLRAMPGLLEARGSVALDELAQELQVPVAVLRAWIYKAVGDGTLQGYMDWKRGLIYSLEARQAQAAGACPGCGGRLELVGRGVVQCPHCGAEIFLTGP
jgi:DNA-directed RNA polymerase subunit RPC12/RpoP